MNVLALETSTSRASVAISSGNRILASEVSMVLRTHSEFLNQAIERCLKISNLNLNDIDLFAAGSGPGSFTGVRVAGNIAKTFSLLFEKPIVTLDSLKLLYLESKSDSVDQYLCLLNAHKNMCYVSLYDKSGEELINPTAMTIPEIQKIKLTGQVLGLGQGFTDYQKAFNSEFLAKVFRSSEIADLPKAEVLAKNSETLAISGSTKDWKSFSPLYIRASEAEENLKLKN